MRTVVSFLFFIILNAKFSFVHSKGIDDTLVSWMGKSIDSMAYVDAKDQDIYIYTR